MREKKREIEKTNGKNKQKRESVKERRRGEALWRATGIPGRQTSRRGEDGTAITAMPRRHLEGGGGRPTALRLQVCEFSSARPRCEDKFNPILFKLFIIFFFFDGGWVGVKQQLLRAR